MPCTVPYHSACYNCASSYFTAPHVSIINDKAKKRTGNIRQITASLKYCIYTGIIGSFQQRGTATSVALGRKISFIIAAKMARFLVAVSLLTMLGCHAGQMTTVKVF